MRYEEKPGQIHAFDDTNTCRGAAWGPAADRSGEWFLRFGHEKAFRVEDRETALAEMYQRLGAPAEVTS